MQIQARVRWRCDQEALEVLAAPAPVTVPEVAARMGDLMRCLYPEDGIVAFTGLYRSVTLALSEDAEDGAFLRPLFVQTLVVRFAHLYFNALRTWLIESRRAPLAWSPLFERRYVSGIEPVRYALAGVNAHICFDLPQAVVETCSALGVRPERGSSEESDYTQINDTLHRVEVRAIQAMATGWIKRVNAWAAPADQDLMMALIRTARDRAWQDAETYWELRQREPVAARRLLARLDQRTSLVSRALLIALG